MPGKSLCNQFRIVPDTLHSDPPNTYRTLLSQCNEGARCPQQLFPLMFSSCQSTFSVGSDRLLMPPFLFLQAAQFKGISSWLVLFPKYVLLLSTYLRLKHLSATCYKVSFLSYFIGKLSQHKLWAAFWFPPSFKENIFVIRGFIYITWVPSRNRLIAHSR